MQPHPGLALVSEGQEARTQPLDLHPGRAQLPSWLTARAPPPGVSEHCGLAELGLGECGEQEDKGNLPGSRGWGTRCEWENTSQTEVVVALGEQEYWEGPGISTGCAMCWVKNGRALGATRQAPEAVGQSWGILRGHLAKLEGKH